MLLTSTGVELLLALELVPELVRDRELRLLEDLLVALLVEGPSDSLLVGLAGLLGVGDIALPLVRVGQVLGEFLFVDFLLRLVDGFLDDGLHAEAVVRVLLLERVLEVTDLGLGAHLLYTQ